MSRLAKAKESEESEVTERCLSIVVRGRTHTVVYVRFARRGPQELYDIAYVRFFFFLFVSLSLSLFLSVSRGDNFE